MTQRLNVVLVDDDPAICQSLQILLQDIADVTYFHEVKPAKTYLEENATDLLILDYQISSENGILFYKNDVKKNWPNIPAVLISGFIVTKLKSPEELQELNDLFLKVFEKPFDFIQLRHFIQEFNQG